MSEHRTDTETLARAMFIIADEITSEDGVANAAIREAGERLLELDKENKELKVMLATYAK